ncbi:hypothetical protein A4E84_00315 [Streptomyces qaidamensis]|uniref:Uncharacterized protein n=1 Tax=Streptomyces qaidamensis TaxID=1783515 RepID=A0A143BTI1_9ACTN|nr:hypothetical protein A4E84_00315 [Streptomyces qaidamensis]
MGAGVAQRSDGDVRQEALVGLAESTAWSSTSAAEFASGVAAGLPSPGSATGAGTGSGAAVVGVMLQASASESAGAAAACVSGAAGFCIRVGPAGVGRVGGFGPSAAFLPVVAHSQPHGSLSDADGVPCRPGRATPGGRGGNADIERMHGITPFVPTPPGIVVLGHGHARPWVPWPHLFGA